MLKKTSERFVNLDGLRFLGALSVFVFHLFSLERQFWATEFDSPLMIHLRQVTNLGSLGVNLFYVLSAFLICSLFLKELEQSGTFSVIHFLKRRARRLWPLYFLIVFFGFFVFPLLPAGFLSSQPKSLFAVFGSNFAEIYYSSKDTPNFLVSLWSISVEQQFYILFACISVLFIRNKRVVLIFGFCLILVSCAFRKSFETENLHLYYNSFSMLSDFGLGIIGAYVWRFFPKVNYFFSKHAGASLIIVLCFFAFVKLFLSDDLKFISQTLLGIGFLVLIFSQIAENNIVSVADRIPFFKYFGQRSYGFYVYHPLIMFYLIRVFSFFDLTSSIFYFPIYGCIAFLLTAVISHVSFTYFELVFINKSFFKKKK